MNKLIDTIDDMNKEAKIKATKQGHAFKGCGKPSLIQEPIKQCQVSKMTCFGPITSNLIALHF